MRPEDEQEHEVLAELLRQGWEPFGVVGLSGTRREFWLRRTVVIDE